MNSVARWSPFRDFNDLFVNLAVIPTAERRDNQRAGWVPPVDISESSDSYQIDMELPAIGIEDISVEVNESILTVSGERAQPTADENLTRHRVERPHGTFSRSFQLPEDVDAEGITARANDGVLTLTLSKREALTPRRIEVQKH